MKSKAALAAVLLAATIFSGCVTAQISKRIFEFSIVPDKGLKSGTIVTVTVKAADDTAQVSAFVDLLPNRIPLKYDQAGKVWTRKEMLPVMYTIPPGKYTVKVEVVSKSGDKSYAEKEVSTY